MKKITLTGLVVTLFLFACNKKNEELPISKYQEFTLKEKSYIEVSNSFAFDMFRTFKDEPTTKNLFISPLSIQFALAMTYNGAENATKIAFEKTLRMSGLSRNEVNSFFNKMNNNLLASDNNVKFTIANSIWYDQKLNVLDSFINANKHYYDAEVVKANFINNTTLTTINNWVNTKTNGKIRTILDEIPDDAAMYLINALYFNGTWKYAFEKDKTVDFPFELNDKSQINCKMMQQQGTFYYTSNETLEMVELPYGNGNFSMYILLPKQVNGSSEFTNKLTDKNWKLWTKASKPINLVVKLPRFKFTWGRTINEEVKAMGLANAFSDSADFNGISTYAGLCISKIIHKTYIDVYEEGTEAAAVTAVEISYTSVGPDKSPSTFIANKPFLFLIQEKTTGSILFMGKINNPNIQ